MPYLIYNIILNLIVIIGLSIAYSIHKAHALYIPLLVMNALCVIAAAVVLLAG